MSMNHHDDHTHVTLSDLHDCLAKQRQHLHAQILVVLLASLLAIGFWIAR